MKRSLMILCVLLMPTGCVSRAIHSKSLVPTRSQPLMQLGLVRVASDDEIRRAVEIVRAHESLRGKPHHIATVAQEPIQVSYLLMNDDVSLRWQPALRFMHTWVTVSGQRHPWVDDPYAYTVNLNTNAVTVPPDYWLIDEDPDANAENEEWVIPFYSKNTNGPTVLPYEHGFISRR